MPTGLQPLDGQLQLAILIAQHHHLYILTLGQMLANVTDETRRYLRNMYETRHIFRQGDKRTKIGDGFYFSFQDGSHSQLHNLL